MPILPSTPEQWSKEAGKCGVLDQSVHELLKVDSASKIGLEQYYSLRVLWVIRPHTLPDATILGFSRDDDDYLEARSFLKQGFTSWQTYLGEIQANPGYSSMKKRQDIGAFSNVRYYQQHVEPSWDEYEISTEANIESVPSKFSPRRLRIAVPASIQSNTLLTPPPKAQNSLGKGSPSYLDSSINDTSLISFNPPSPQTPATAQMTAPAEDEQIVNVALVLWLQTLTMFHSDVQAEGLKWSIKRLKLNFGRWEARTDGCLRRKREIMAILEVKPFVRENYAPQIQIQESAQTGAWIRNFPDVGGWFVVKDGRKLERSV